MGLLLGIDLGTSAVKASLVDSVTGKAVASSTIPAEEIPRYVEQPGWCEQAPEDWYDALQAALKCFSPAQLSSVSHIGIAYQMHGLVLLDAAGAPVRRSIIWSDGRATASGEAIANEVGEETVTGLLNRPGNFTAAKLRWVRDHEPNTVARAKYAMLPGDYFAYRLTGDASTTSTGLSEMMAWDYAAGSPSLSVWQAAGGGTRLQPPLVPILGVQGVVSAAAAQETGLPVGTPITYRAGDQPNNALSLNVFEPGEVAATAGTSGVLYAVTSNVALDPLERVNTFLHVNSTEAARRLGVLLCVNGAGGFYSWIRKLLNASDFGELNALAEQAPPGANGVRAIPYGNGAERSLGNRYLGASLADIDLNFHTRADIARAAQEAVIFALRYGFDVMRELGIEPQVIRAGSANMFKSSLFSQLFADVTNTRIELFDTDGSIGAARGAGLGGGVYASPAEAFASLERVASFQPSPESVERYEGFYRRWLTDLEKLPTTP